MSGMLLTDNAPTLLRIFKSDSAHAIVYYRHVYSNTIYIVLSVSDTSNLLNTQGNLYC